MLKVEMRMEITILVALNYDEGDGVLEKKWRLLSPPNFATK